MKDVMKKFLILNALFVTSLIVLLSSVFAWYKLNEFIPIVLESGEFDVVMIVTFDGIEVGENSVYYDAVKKVIRIDASKETAPNYIGKLKIDLEVRTDIAARFRLKIQDEWQLVRYYAENTTISVINHVKTAEGPIDNPFIIDQSFPYKADNWGYIYYDGIILPSTESTVFNVVTKGTKYLGRVTDMYYEECYVDLDLLFDIVQANRFSERWLINNNFFD